MNSKPTEPPFDLEAVYDNEISPLMEQIIAICKRERMPMIASFCYAKGKVEGDPEGLDYCTTLIPRGDWQTPDYNKAAAIIRHGFFSMMVKQSDNTK
jgi:hypothetical protein